ncbi:Urease accessory protein [Phytophthora palmivora]|uniref:Urease accessory protein n=1 Tax=Phytophthora palmivora TaxID=4796 RepID=A0A2P4WVT3_9STRA|nr:Urease accessory protein [Phytophthora palmivora]
MLVKVDGCGSVWCVCGFNMSWTDELRIKNLHQRKLLQVDPFDRTMYDYWASWHYAFQCAAGENDWELRQSAMLHSLNYSHPVFRETFRQFIWMRRYRQMIMNAELKLRHKFVIRLYPEFKESLRTLVWRRRRFHQKLLDDCRVAFVVQTTHRQSQVIKPVVFKLMWYCRFRKVLGSLLRRFYCISKGWRDLTEDQLEIEEEQLAFLSIGLN